jgi:hypothetical protein
MPRLPVQRGGAQSVIRRGLVEQDSTRQIIAAFAKGSEESLVGRMGGTISDASAERVHRVHAG